MEKNVRDLNSIRLEILLSLMSKTRGAYKMSKINITSLHMSKIKIARWRLLKVLFLVNLDTLYLKEFLFYIPSSNGSTRYMVGKYYSETFPMVYGSLYNSIGMRRYDFFSSNNPARKLRSAQRVFWGHNYYKY
jgi:hypothetical protein